MTASAGEVFNAAGWLLGRNAAATPDRVAATAIDLDGSATDVSYGELDGLAWRAAAGLVAAGIRGLGIGPDDVCYSAAKFFFAYGLGNTLTFPFSVGARAILDRARATPARLAGRGAGPAAAPPARQGEPA